MFRLPNAPPALSTETLFEQNQQRLRDLVELAQNQAADATTALQSYSEVVVAATNLRLLRRTLRYTRFAVFVAVAAFILSVVALHH